MDRTNLSDEFKRDAVSRSVDAGARQHHGGSSRRYTNLRGA